MTQERTVNHNRLLLRAVFCRILKLEPLRLDKVKLHRGDLPVSANGIGGHKVYFGAVKGGFTLLYVVVEAVFFGELLSGPGPLLIVLFSPK